MVTDMITLYSGTPGSGKSLHQASDIFYWLKYKRPCITNYEVNTDIIPKCDPSRHVYLPNDELKPDFLIDFSRQWFKKHRFKEGGIRLYIDEAQLLFNAREWQQNGRADWISFFTQHRKYGYDIYLVAQFDRMLDRQVRSLLEYEVIHRKVSNFGLPGKLMSIVSGGKLFVAVTMWYPLKEKIGSEFFKYHKRYSRLYDTYKDFNGNVQNDESTAEKSVPKAEKSADGTPEPAPSVPDEECQNGDRCVENCQVSQIVEV